MDEFCNQDPKTGRQKSWKTDLTELTIQYQTSLVFGLRLFFFIEKVFLTFCLDEEYSHSPNTKLVWYYPGIVATLVWLPPGTWKVRGLNPDRDFEYCIELFKDSR